MTILLWALGVGGDYVSDAVVKFVQGAYNDKSLNGRLADAVNKWLKSEQLDTDTQVALFNWQSQEMAANQPYRRKLAGKINDQVIPEPDDWKNALMERYEEVRLMHGDKGGLLPLFLKSPEDAGQLFTRLAKLLTNVCTQNSDLFTVDVRRFLLLIIDEIKKIGHPKAEITTQEMLSAFSDYLNNKRVLYLHFSIEEKYPLTAMSSSIEQIRNNLNEKVIPHLAAGTEEKSLANRMLYATHHFNDNVVGMRDWERPDLSMPLSKQAQETRDIIEKALLAFRRDFLQPMLYLFTKHKVSIPDAVIRSIDSLRSFDPPRIIYVRGLPVRTDKDLWYAGNETYRKYLRICTLGEATIVNEIMYPAGTELYFYDPLEVQGKVLPWKVDVHESFSTHDVNWKKGDFFYFTKDGELRREDPVTYPGWDR